MKVGFLPVACEFAAEDLLESGLARSQSLFLLASGASLRCTSLSALPCHIFSQGQAGHTPRLDTTQTKTCKGRRNFSLETRRQGDPSARCRREPVYPCTVPGGGACSVGVSPAVAISAYGALPHSSHKDWRSGCNCEFAGSRSTSIYTFLCCIPAALLRDITELHLHEPVSTCGSNFGVVCILASRIMATFDDFADLKTRWNSAYEEKDADELWQSLHQDSSQAAALAEELTSSEATAGFQVACQEGHLELMRDLLSQPHGLAVDVHAADRNGAEAAFRLACENGYIYIVRELLGLTGEREVDVHAADRYGTEAAFRRACENGYIYIVRELLGLTGEREVDVHAADRDGPEAAFRVACRLGHTHVVRELLALSKTREVDVHAKYMGTPEAAFRCACANGHTDIARELLGLTGAREVDVHVADWGGPEAAFREACKGGHLDIVHELLALTGHRAIPVRVWQKEGETVAQVARDTAWAGTGTRRGRRAILMFRSHGAKRA